MTTDQQLRSEYDDILEPEDDARSLRIVRGLQAAFPVRQPPAALHQRMAETLERHARAGSAHPVRLPKLRNRGRRRLSLAVLVLAVAGIGAGTSGLAAAAVNTVRTHLFSNPPPSPQAAVWVGSFAPPLWGGCAPHPTTSPVVAPDGRQFAQLGTVPDDLAGSVAATFPPCWPRPPRPGVTLPRQPANLQWENITAISVVRYTGTAGQVEIDTGQATAEGMRRGLYLGNPAGTLADGTPVYDLVCSGGCAYRDNLRWLQDGLIVNLSGGMSVERLKQLASRVKIE
jgi:hypothetical protein